MKNNFYYIKARSFQKNRFSTYSNQVLLSPQKESDTRAPEILDFSAIKVPVYQKKIINMSQYIFEDSGVNNIQNISIDFDGEIDTNHNGDFYDDKDYEMWKTQTGIEISKEGWKIFLNVWPFDRLYDKKIRIHMTDSNSNTGYKDIWFIIYSPIPSITSVQDNKVINGKIDESLWNEPVDFYRIRWGSIDKLKGSSKNTAETIEWWKFNLNLWVEWSLANGLSIKQAEKELFTVDEVTGKINKPDFDSTLSIKIYASNNANNDWAYPKIIVSKNNIPIYHESISLPNIGKVEIVEDFKNLNKIWVYYKQISNNYAYFQNPLWITQNPWDIFIYQSSDTTKTPVFKIFKDGRIETLWDVYYLEYDTFDTYIVYNLRKVWVNDIIWKVMIIPEKNYILK